MNREQAKKIGLYYITRWAEQHGWDSVYLAAPKIGKNTWTAREYKDALEQDKCLEEKSNPIDMILDLERYYIEHGKSLKNEPEIKDILNL